MLDFRRPRTARGAGPFVQRRMFSLLTGSVLVVMLVLLSGDPRNWRWFAPEVAPPEPEQRVTHAAGDVTLAVADVQPAPEAPHPWA